MKKKEEIAAKAGALRTIDQVLGRVDAKLHDRGAAESISASDVIRAIGALRKEYPNEFSLLGIYHTVPSICRRILAPRLGPSWDPLTEPSLPGRLFAEWMSSCADLEEEDRAAAGDRRLQRQPRVSTLMPSLMKVAESLCLFRIRRCLTNDWNVHDQADAAAELVAGLVGSSRAVGVISAAEAESLFSTCILPKLRAEIDKWSIDKPPMHQWLFPWLPLIKAELSTLYPDVRRKLGDILLPFAIFSVLLYICFHSAHCLHGWSPSDPWPLCMLTPWKGVFDSTSMDNLIVR